MEILGHSQISLTANLYTHIAEAVQAEALNKMDAVLKPLAVNLAVKGPNAV